MVENEGNNNKFFLDTGTFTGDGKKRYFKPFAGSVDMFRVPTDVISGLLKGDPSAVASAVSNRFSFPVGAAVHLGANQDYLHRPIYGQDKYGNEIPVTQAVGGITNELLGGVGFPTQARAGVDLMTDKINPEQALAQTFEIPVKYEGNVYSNSQKEKRETYQGAGLEGEGLYNAMHKGQDEGESGGGLINGLKGLFGMNKDNEQVAEEEDPMLSIFNSEAESDKKTSRIREIFKDPALQSKDKIERVLEKENLGTYDDAILSIAKSLGVENGSRYKFIQQYTKDMSDDELESTLVDLADKKILTNAVITQAVDDGELTDDEGDILKDLIKETTGKAGKGKKAKKITIKDVPSFGSLPSVKTPSIKPLEIQGSTIKPFQKTKLSAYRQALTLSKARKPRAQEVKFKPYV
jgi:hypothetical protein